MAEPDRAHRRSVLTAATGFVLKLLGQKPETANPFHTVEDIGAMQQEADEQGVLDGRVVKGAVAFQDCEARHLMTPRSRVVAIRRGARGLLTEMRLTHRHMVLVVDEHGIVVGLVTLEDLFEAIVGDIRDERDEPEQEVAVVGEDVLEVDGGWRCAS